ncbi:hypothetical protein ABER99_20270 [Paenibacillus glucanolyticus]|nr:hypothetical protein [Paenibacillus glucanolyticus]
MSGKSMFGQLVRGIFITSLCLLLISFAPKFIELIPEQTSDVDSSLDLTPLEKENAAKGSSGKEESSEQFSDSIYQLKNLLMLFIKIVRFILIITLLVLLLLFSFSIISGEGYWGTRSERSLREERDVQSQDQAPSVADALENIIANATPDALISSSTDSHIPIDLSKSFSGAEVTGSRIIRESSEEEHPKTNDEKPSGEIRRIIHS